MSAQPAGEAVDTPVSNGALNGGVTGLLEKTPLRFPRSLEDVFVDDYRSKSLTMVRISFVMGIALYAAFGVLDVFIAPLTRNITWLIRYAIVCPLMVVSLGASWLPAFKKFMEIDTMVIGLAAGIGIIAMIAFARDADVTRYYYAGLILVLIYVYTFTKMRFALATLTCWLIVVGYEAVAVAALRMMSTHELFIVFLNNNFFFIAANIMGMLVCFYMERYARQDFLRRLLVIEKQELLQSERNLLFDKNRLMKRELELARRIQQSFIPRTTPNPTFFALYRPMEEVGGDYFDFLATGEEGKVGVFMSDVSGHGVPAALITSMMKSSITQSAALRRDPAKLLCHLNSALLDQTDENFITVFYGIYDARSRRLVYANAGHNPPYVCHGDRVMELPAPKRHFPIAFLGNEETAQRQLSYRNYQVALPKDSKLVFYTDGMIEVAQRGSSPMRFKDVVKEKIVSLMSLPPRGFVEGLMQELIQFRQGEDFDDDICIICMEVT
jgi:serine phosphatase RsbU (regulator of sigma subunit)